MAVKLAVKDRRHYVSIEGGKNRESVHFIPSDEHNIEEVAKPCFLFLDQATNSGYALFDNKNRLIMTGVVQKGRAGLQEYKFKFKEILEELVEDYGVETIFHEEVYDKDNMWTTEVLLYIKHMVQDIAYLNKDVEVFGVDHMTWKGRLAGQGKFNYKADHKKEVKKFVEGVYPILFMDVKYGELTGDMIDALGMGIGLLVKQTRRGNFYDTVRYKKNLPIHEFLVSKGDKEWDEVIAKCRKPYRDAYEVGGIMEVELDRRKGIGDLFKRYLTHRDGVVCVKVPRDYKDWGINLLKHGKKPSDLPEDKEYWLIAVRKRRK